MAVEFEETCFGVLDAFAAAAQDGDVMRGPHGAEGLAEVGRPTLGRMVKRELKRSQKAKNKPADR